MTSNSRQPESKIDSCQLKVSLGTVLVEWNSEGRLTTLRWLNYSDTQKSKKTILKGKKDLPPRLLQVFDHLREYFESGQPFPQISFDDLATDGWSDFQKEVYKATLMIPHGETRSYAWVAERVGKVFATRAVGQSLRNNPVPILIPCHRVVSSQGGYGGFMGKKDPDQPELKLKRRLIELEVNYRNPVFPFLSDYLENPPLIQSALA